MKRVLIGCTLAAALMIVGCKGGSTSATGSTPASGGATAAKGGEASQDPMVGMYSGEIKMPEAKKDDPAAQMSQGLAEMFTGMIHLKVEDGGKFVLLVFGIPIEGDLSKSGEDLTLTPKTIAGMAPEEAQKALSSGQTPVDPTEFKDPMKAKIDAAGNITIIGKKAEDGNMVFAKRAEAARKEGPASVTDAEKELVASYKADPESIDTASMSEEEKKQLPMLKAMASYGSLKLNADNTFDMFFVMFVEGTWKMEKEKLVLTPTKIGGSEEQAKNNKPMTMTSKDGKLTVEPGTGGPPISFVKA